MDSSKLDEIMRFIRIIQPVRVIEWENIEIQENLGEGSYGTVKLVKIPSMTTPLTMKILKPLHYSNKEEQELSFEKIHREIQLLQSCSHPNILPLYGISINFDKKIFQIGILTPLKWGSLAKLLKLIDENQDTPENLPPGIKFNNEVKQKIIFGISAGLFYLSSKKIIHRDIKPENILLDDNFNPLLCDFGFAKETMSKGTLNMSENFGTPLYQAPEIFSDSGQYSEKVDIYSWAIVINSILDETMPWKQLLSGGTDIHPFLFYDKIRKGIRPPLIEGVEYKLYQDLITKGWDPDPTKRPSTKEIIETLLMKEANLPDVDPKIIHEYQNEVMSSIPDFSITLYEKLNDLESKFKEQQTLFEKQNQLIESFQKKFSLMEMQYEKQNKLIESLQKKVEDGNKTKHHKKKDENTSSKQSTEISSSKQSKEDKQKPSKTFNFFSSLKHKKVEEPQPLTKNEISIEHIEFSSKDPEVKVLTLGAGNCGLGVIWKQIKLLYCGGFDEEELSLIRNSIRIDIISDIQTLLQEITTDNPSIKESLLNDPEFLNTITFSKNELVPEVAHCISKIWANPDFKHLAQTNYITGLSNNWDYFFNNVERIAQDNYIPTNEDILKSNYEPIGLTTLDFLINNITTQLVRKTGVKKEQKNFFNFFLNVDILLFFVSISDFDQTLFEDNETNVTQNLITFFHQLVSYSFFESVPVLLVMNNKDQFEKKLQEKPDKFREAFPGFKGKINYESCIEFVKTSFLNGLNSRNASIEVIPISQMNQDNICTLFQQIAKKVIQIKQ